MRGFGNPQPESAFTPIGISLIYAIGRSVAVLQNTPQFVSQNLPVALIGLVVFFLLIRLFLFGFDTMLIQ